MIDSYVSDQSSGDAGVKQAGAILKNCLKCCSQGGIQDCALCKTTDDEAAMSGLLEALCNREVLCHPPVPYSPVYNWLLAAILASPHALYCLVWFRPQVWTSVFNDISLETFALAGTLGKGE